MIKASENSNQDVTANDQFMINTFAKLTLKTEELQEKHDDLEREFQNLLLAESELMFDDLEDDFGDDELNNENDCSKMDNKNPDSKEKIKPSSNMQFKLGSLFIAVSKSEMESLLEKSNIELKAKMNKLDESLAPMKQEMNDIKTKLKAKFGNNINLDP